MSTESLPSPVAAYEVAATLDNRTYSSGEDPQHTTADLGSWDANDVSARLDLGALQVDATDLAVNTYGPPAQISRTYLASNSGARFRPRLGLQLRPASRHLADRQQRDHLLRRLRRCPPVRLQRLELALAGRLSWHAFLQLLTVGLADHLPRRHDRHLHSFRHDRRLVKRVGPQRQHHDLCLERQQPNDHRRQRPDDRRELQLIRPDR